MKKTAENARPRKESAKRPSNARALVLHFLGGAKRDTYGMDGCLIITVRSHVASRYRDPLELRRVRPFPRRERVLLLKPTSYALEQADRKTGGFMTDNPFRIHFPPPLLSFLQTTRKRL